MLVNFQNSLILPKKTNNLKKSYLKNKTTDVSSEPMSFQTATILRNSALCKLSFKAKSSLEEVTQINGIKLQEINIKKFSVVEIDKCYRGAQPTTKDLKQLKKLGVKTIVNLRDYLVDKLPEEEQKIFLTDNSFKKYPKEIGKFISKYKNTDKSWYIELLKEKCTTEKLGMRFVNIPMSTKIPPTREKIDKLLQITSDTESAPVYIHCLYGRDRTGFVSALYKIKKQGWSFEKAVKDQMKEKDYKVLPGYCNLINCLNNYINSGY